MARVLLAARLGPTGEAVPLTTREKEIVQLVVAGYHNGDIARQLSISESTVKII
jgi:DNA-binding NarL/FixJ family response regulator